MSPRYLVLTLCTVLFAFLGSVRAQVPVALPASATAPYYAPDQTPCQDCITHRCVLVPDVKQIKKTVYEVQEVPYCLKKLPPLFSLHKRACDDCAECDCVRYKKVLVKKEIVCCEIPTTKCVPETCATCQPGISK